MTKLKIFFFSCLTLFFIISCNRYDTSNSSKKSSLSTLDLVKTEWFIDSTFQIGEYVVALFEDKKGQFWMGTLGKGVACYDGKKLTYFSEKDGLSGNAVVSIAEDKAGNLWFGTQSGLSKYDGKKFESYTLKEGADHNRISKVMIDTKGQIWIGTWAGVYRFDGTTFSKFELPIPDIQLQSYQTTMNWVTEIMEDKQGNIWICRDGYGACKYDGKTFTHLTKKDGLASNNVQAIEEDNNGNIWFGSRVAEKDKPEVSQRVGDGGLSRYDGKKIVEYPQVEGLSKSDIYAIYNDSDGIIWIGVSGRGLYRFDGKEFNSYNNTNRMDLTYGLGLQSILKNKNGILWLGFSGGLFRLEGSEIINVTQGGPWK